MALWSYWVFLPNGLIQARQTRELDCTAASQAHSGPGGHDVIHDSLTQPLGHLVELQEVPDTVEHLMVPVGVGVHLLENGRHVPKDGGIEEG